MRTVAHRAERAPRAPRRAALALAISGAAALLAPGPAPAAVEPEAAWTELGPGRAVLARLITTAERCPKLRLRKPGGTKRKRMSVRAAAEEPDYPVLTCHHRIGRRVRAAAVAGESLPIPEAKPTRFAIVGDTGCRLEDGDGFQSCDVPSAWPFERVARKIARWDPGLVIHVGDYLYRQDACPEGDAGCAGSPYGYNWATWDADFFSPARAGLEAAPWLFVRGNHETCERAGKGWFRFLYPVGRPETCTDVTDPYAVRVGNRRMLVLDSSDASDEAPYNPEPYVSQFEALAGEAGKRAWFLTHRPIWAVYSTGGGGFGPTNETLQEASGNSLPPAVKAVLSGHLHIAEALGYGDRPAQIVAGQGGTELDAAITDPVVGAEVAGEPVVEAEIVRRYGFTTLRAPSGRGGGWRLAIRGTDGGALARCRLEQRTLSCG